jgi:hypothetical protein
MNKMTLLRATRLCDKCSSDRVITMIRETADTLAGETITGEFGSAKCQCKDTKLNDLDLKALRKPTG